MRGRRRRLFPGKHYNNDADSSERIQYSFAASVAVMADTRAGEDWFPLKSLLCPRHGLTRSIESWGVHVSMLPYSYFCFCLFLFSRQRTLPCDGAIAEWSECWTFDPAVGVPVPLASGGRVAIVGQLLFAPWGGAYSALHPWMVGKWVPVTTGKER